jgi:hypothetical protein
LTSAHSSQLVTALGKIVTTTDWPVVLAAGRQHTLQPDIAIKQPGARSDEILPLPMITWSSPAGSPKAQIRSALGRRGNEKHPSNVIFKSQKHSISL